MEVINNKIMEYAVNICECEKCGRIIIGKKVSDGESISFSPDIPAYHMILTSEFKGFPF